MKNEGVASLQKAKGPRLSETLHASMAVLVRRLAARIVPNEAGRLRRDNLGAEVGAVEADVPEQMVVELEEARIHTALPRALKESGDQVHFSGPLSLIRLALSGAGAFTGGADIITIRTKVGVATVVVFALIAEKNEARENRLGEVGHLSCLCLPEACACREGRASMRDRLNAV